MPDVLGVIAQVGRGSGLEEIAREFDAVMEAVRASGGKLSMWYDMLRVDEMLAAEFETARQAVAASAECEVLLGAA